MRMGFVSCGSMRPSASTSLSEWDFNQYKRRAALFSLDARLTAERFGASHDRARRKGIGRASTLHYVLYLNQEMLLREVKAQPRALGTRVPSDVTQAFGHHLKRFGGEPVINMNPRRRCFDFNGKTRCLREFCRVAAHSQEQA